MSVSLRWLEDHAEDSLTVEALVEGPENRTDLFLEILFNVPATYGSLVFNRLESATLLEGRVDMWKCRIKYAAFREKRELQAGESEFVFSSAQRSITRTWSIDSRVYDESGNVTSSTPDARIIGYNEQERRADGTEVTEYLNAFSWRVAVPFSVATESWRRAAGDLRGSVNQSSFFGYNAGEVMFTDITGSVRGDQLYRFELSFLQGLNPGTITIGGISVPSVKFWEHLDIDDQQLVESNGIIVPKVRRVKVHQMKPIASWAILSSLLGV